MQVVVASNHAIVREGLVRLLQGEPSFTAEGRSFEEHPRAGDATDVVLCVGGPRPDVATVVNSLHVEYPDSKLLVLLLADDDSSALSALRCGVQGVLDQAVGASELVDCIKQAAAGEFAISSKLARRLAQLHGSRSTVARAGAPDTELTQREFQVLQLLAEGGTNRDIAAQLSLSEHTVRAHLRGIMQKLHVSNRVQAAALAWQGQLEQRTIREDKRPNGNSSR